MDASSSARRPARAWAVVAVVAVVAVGTDAGAAPSGVALPAIEIVTSPKVQTLDTKVVAAIDARTHARAAKLVLGTARFTITVTNPNAAGLSGVAVVDPRSPACSRHLGTLAPGRSISYSCSIPNVARSYTNVATVSGLRAGVRGLTGAQAMVTASATSAVRVRTQVTTNTGVPSFTG